MEPGVNQVVALSVEEVQHVRADGPPLLDGQASDVGELSLVVRQVAVSPPHRSDQTPIGTILLAGQVLGVGGPIGDPDAHIRRGGHYAVTFAFLALV